MLRCGIETVLTDFLKSGKGDGMEKEAKKVIEELGIVEENDKVVPIDDVENEWEEIPDDWKGDD